MDSEKLQSSMKLLVRSSFLIFLAILASKLFTYAYRIVIARYFGAEIYGLLTLAIMVSGWFSAFSSFGLAEGLLRYISIYRGKNEKDKIKHVYQITTRVLLVASLIAGALLFFLSEYIAITFFHNDQLIIFLQIFSITIPTMILSGAFLSVMRAYEKVGWQSFIFNVVQNGVKLVVLVAMIFFGFRANSIIGSYVAGTLIVLIVSYLFCRYKLTEIFGKYYLEDSKKKKITKELFSYSWPIMFFFITTSLLYWVDSFALGYFKDASAVGFYNVAIPIAALLTFIPELFMQMFFPLIGKEFSQKNFHVIKELSQQVGKWIFVFNIPVFIVMILFPGAIINILFGAEYLVSETALRFLSVSMFFVALFTISHDLLAVLGKSKLVLVDTIIVFFINVFLNIMLVPMYGIDGAAFSTMLSLIILYSLYIFQTYKYMKVVPIRRKMGRIALLSILPTLLLLFLRAEFGVNDLFNLVIFGMVFFVFYIGLVVVFKCLDKNDYVIIKSVIRRFKRSK